MILTTFSFVGGGFNNIRMSMETMIVMAHAMSRTLVMPPSQGMYLMRKDLPSGSKVKSFYQLPSRRHLVSSSSLR